MIVALKIPNSKAASEENKENIQQTDVVDDASKQDAATAMEVEANESKTDEQQPQQSGTAAAAVVSEVEMVSDVDCSISENDWKKTKTYQQPTVLDFPWE